jgi:hypothetical protein
MGIPSVADLMAASIVDDLNDVANEGKDVSVQIGTGRR